MTDFQVGDRVSVEGVVRKIGSLSIECHIPGTSDRFYAPPANLALVERPRRKLRVGSVWEHDYLGRKAYVIGQRAGADLFVPLDGLGVPLLRSQTNFDTHPQDWREVPVEELEREEQR